MTLAITGMTCGACAARIERRLNGLGGVSAQVNYASERATVTLPPELDKDRLLGEVAAAGYSATIVGPATAAPPEDLDDRVRTLRRRLLVAAILFMPSVTCPWASGWCPLSGSGAGSGCCSFWQRRWWCGRPGRSMLPPFGRLGTGRPPWTLSSRWG